MTGSSRLKSTPSTAAFPAPAEEDDEEEAAEAAGGGGGGPGSISPSNDLSSGEFVVWTVWCVWLTRPLSESTDSTLSLSQTVHPLP